MNHRSIEQFELARCVRMNSGSSRYYDMDLDSSMELALSRAAGAHSSGSLDILGSSAVQYHSSDQMMEPASGAQ